MEKFIGHTYIDNETNLTLDVFFTHDNEYISRSCLAETVGIIRGEKIEVTFNSPEDAPKNSADAYLRLHLLSFLRFKPNELNLNGIFGLLNNVAWTNAGPVLPNKVNELRKKIASENLPHHLQVTSIDKFPRMTDYIIPEGVRIGDADRIRLGAHLAPGTTVMHEGFVNFNAGTLGSSMVEGRVTPGVAVGEGSDIGAGSSIMGTLSGGGKQVNAIGQGSLLGANAGTGISLGDHSIIEAGLYVTAGTKVLMPDGQICKAKDLSGKQNLLFRRNSQTGAVEVVPIKGTDWGGLNTELHGKN